MKKMVLLFLINFIAQFAMGQTKLNIDFLLAAYNGAQHNELSEILSKAGFNKCTRTCSHFSGGAEKYDGYNRNEDEFLIDDYLTYEGTHYPNRVKYFTNNAEVYTALLNEVKNHPSFTFKQDYSPIVPGVHVFSCCGVRVSFFDDPFYKGSAWLRPFKEIYLEKDPNSY